MASVQTTPNIQTRTGDMSVEYSVNPLTGQLIVDIGQIPNGDLQQLTGTPKLVQTITRWLLTPQGANPLDPHYGNPLYNELGRPMPRDLSPITAMVQLAQDTFLKNQQVEAAQGFLAQDEMVQEFRDLQVRLRTGNNGQIVPGVLDVSFTIVAQSGDTLPAIVPFTGLSF